MPRVRKRAVGAVVNVTIVGWIGTKGTFNTQEVVNVPLAIPWSPIVTLTP